MRHSTEPKYRNYVEGYGFVSFARKVGDKYGKKSMDTTRKAGIDAAKTACKRVVQKTEEATADLITNTTSNSVPRFNTKKWVQVHAESGKSYNINTQRRFKTSMLRSVYVITVVHILLPKELLLLFI